MKSILQSRRGATWKCPGAPKCFSNRVSLWRAEAEAGALGADEELTVSTPWSAGSG